jgi:hypothetical protein
MVKPYRYYGAISPDCLITAIVSALQTTEVHSMFDSIDSPLLSPATSSASSNPIAASHTVASSPATSPQDMHGHFGHESPFAFSYPCPDPDVDASQTLPSPPPTANGKDTKPPTKTRRKRYPCQYPNCDRLLTSEYVRDSHDGRRCPNLLSIDTHAECI